MKLETGLRATMKHHDNNSDNVESETLLPRVFILHWKEGLATTAVRNPETRAMLDPASG